MDAARLARKRGQWYAFTKLEPILQSVCHDNPPAERLPPRLRRLFCAAVCRRIWHLMPDEESRANVETAEADADREVSQEERDAYWERLRAGMDVRRWPHMASLCALVAGCGGTSGAVVLAVRESGGDGAEEEKRHTDLLRDILGEWFDPVAFLPAWRTGGAVELAAEMYRGRAFDRLPELGRALAAAGCDEPRVLDHCASACAHTKGCWVVDGVLGKRPQS